MSGCTYHHKLVAPARRSNRVVPRLSISLLAACVWLLPAATPAVAQLEKTKRVGPVQVKAKLTPEKPVIGDQLTLELTVLAEAKVEVLMPEFGEALERYRIVDFVPRKKISDDGSTTLTQRYTIQPLTSGPQSIPPILVEFVDNRPGKKAAPDDLDAYEILTDRIDFAVQSVLPKDAANKLKPPLGELSLETGRQPSAVAWFVPGLIVLVAVASAVGLIAWRKWQRKAVRRNAYEVAKARLKKLLGQASPGTEAEIDAFYVALSGIVRRYLEDRFDLRAPDLTTEEFMATAADAGDLSGAHQELLRDFLRQADMVKFAGVTTTATEIDRSTSAAIQFLEETRADAPLVDADDLETEVAHA